MFQVRGPRSWRNPGLSLVEIILATGLTALCLITMLGVLPTTTSCLKKAEDLNAATAYGEEVLNCARQTLPLHASPPPPSFSVTLNGTSFRVETAVVPLQSRGTYTLQQVVVTLTPGDEQGRPIRLGRAIKLVGRVVVRHL